MALVASLDRDAECGERHAEDGEDYADPAGCEVAEAARDDHAAEPRAEAVADVEGCVVDGGAQEGGLVGDAHESRLDGREERRRGESEEEHGDEEADRVRGDEAVEHERGDERAETDEHRAREVAVGGPSADEVAEGHADAEGREHPGHDAGAEARLARRDFCDVRVDGEEPAEADGADGDHDPEARVLEGDELLHGAAFGVAGVAGHEEEDEEERDEEDGGDEDVRVAPAAGLAEPGREGHAEDVGDREAGEREGDALALLARAHDAGGEQRGDAEVGAVGERRDEAHDGCCPEVGHEGGCGGGDDEDAEQPEGELRLRHAGREHREHGGTDHNTEGVRGDEDASLRDHRIRVLLEAGEQFARDVGQQAHGGELGDADAEASERKREEGDSAPEGGEFGHDLHVADLCF